MKRRFQPVFSDTGSQTVYSVFETVRNRGYSSDAVISGFQLPPITADYLKPARLAIFQKAKCMSLEVQIVGACLVIH
jgi:hypothetical protein